MQVTFGEEGSGLSKPDPLPFFEGNMAGDWAPLRLPLWPRRRLREEERDAADLSAARPGLRIDLEDRRIEEEFERRDVKQMKSSLLVVGVLLVLRGFSISIIEGIFLGISIDLTASIAVFSSFYLLLSLAGVKM